MFMLFVSAACVTVTVASRHQTASRSTVSAVDYTWDRTTRTTQPLTFEWPLNTTDCRTS